MSSFIPYGLFICLLDGKQHTAKSLAEKFEVSTKTIYRNIDKLVFAGFPLTTSTGKNGGIMLANNIKFTNLFFTEGEISLLLTLLNSCNQLDNQETSTLISKLQKYLNR